MNIGKLFFIFLFLFGLVSLTSAEEVLYEGEDTAYHNDEPWFDSKAELVYDDGFIEADFYAKNNGEVDWEDERPRGRSQGISLSFMGNNLIQSLDMEENPSRGNKNAMYTLNPEEYPQDEFEPHFSTRVHLTRVQHWERPFEDVSDICLAPGPCLIEEGHVDEDFLEDEVEYQEDVLEEEIEAEISVSDEIIQAEVDFADFTDRAEKGVAAMHNSYQIIEGDIIDLNQGTKTDFSVPKQNYEGQKICLYIYGKEWRCIDIEGEEETDPIEDIDLSFDYPGDRLIVGETVEITAYVPEEHGETRTLDTDGGGTEWALTEEDRYKIAEEKTVEIDIENDDRGEIAVRIAHHTDLGGRTTHEFKTVPIHEAEEEEEDLIHADIGVGHPVKVSHEDSLPIRLHLTGSEDEYIDILERGYVDNYTPDVDIEGGKIDGSTQKLNIWEEKSAQVGPINVLFHFCEHDHEDQESTYAVTETTVDTEEVCEMGAEGIGSAEDDVCSYDVQGDITGVDEQIEPNVQAKLDEKNLDIQGALDRTYSLDFETECGATIELTYTDPGQEIEESTNLDLPETPDEVQQNINVEQDEQPPEDEENTFTVTPETAEPDQEITIETDVTQQIAENGYEIEVAGPEQKTFELQEQQNTQEFTLDNPGDYTAKLKPGGGLLSEITETLLGENVLAEKEFTVEGTGTTDWEGYCQQQNYDTETISEQVECIEDEIVPKYFEDVTGSQPEIAESLCQDLLEYSYNEQDNRCAN